MTRSNSTMRGASRISQPMIDENDLKWEPVSQTGDDAYQLTAECATTSPWHMLAHVTAQLARFGFTPAQDTDDELAGWCFIHRHTTNVNGEQNRHYWLIGSGCFVAGDARLFVEVLCGQGLQRTSLAACFDAAQTMVLGVRYIGQAIDGGKGLEARIMAVASDLCLKYSPILPPKAWVQVPYMQESAGRMRVGYRTLTVQDVAEGAGHHRPDPYVIVKPELLTKRGWKRSAPRRAQLLQDGFVRLGGKAYHSFTHEDYVYLGGKWASQDVADYRIALADYKRLEQKAQAKHGETAQ